MVRAETGANSSDSTQAVAEIPWKSVQEPGRGQVALFVLIQHFTLSHQGRGDFCPDSTSLSSDIVYMLQQEFRGMGLKRGPLDGGWASEILGAVRAYRESNGGYFR